MKAAIWAALVCLGCGASAGGEAVPGETEEPPPCEVGATRCDGRLLQTCIETEHWFAWRSDEDCGSPTLCDPDAGCSSQCTPGEGACFEHEFRVCNADGTGFDLAATCAGPEYCNPEGCELVGSPCERAIDFWHCDGEELILCPAWDTWDQAENCDLERICREGFDACRS